MKFTKWGFLNMKNNEKRYLVQDGQYEGCSPAEVIRRTAELERFCEEEESMLTPEERERLLKECRKK